MKITAITKFKEGVIWSLLKKHNWTQSDLARKAGICPSRMGQIINLRRKPTPEQANKIQKAFAKAGDAIDVMAIWPESFRGFEKSLVIEQTRDIELLLPNVERIALHDAFSPNLSEARMHLEKAIDSRLTPVEAKVVREVYFEQKTMRDVAANRKLSDKRISQIAQKAIRKLRQRKSTEANRSERHLFEAKSCLERIVPSTV